MKEPLRWLADPKTPSELRQLLSGADAAPPLPSELRGRLFGYAKKLAAGGLVSSSVGLMSEGSAAAKVLGLWTGATVGTKLVLGSVLLGAVGGAGYVALAPQVVEPAPVTSVVPPSAAPHQPTPSVKAMTAAIPVAHPTGNSTRGQPVPAPAGQPFAAASGSIPSVAPPASGSVAVAAFADPTLKDEALWLETARAALGQDPQHALELADRHRQHFPTGQLGAERELIAVDALLRLGRRDEAERRAQPSLAQASGSLYQRRLRQLLQGEPH